MIEVKYPQFQLYQYSGKDHTLKQLLEDKFQIQEEDVEDVFSSTQLSKVERRTWYVYFALQFPTFSSENLYIQIKQIHCFVSPAYLFVIDESGYQIPEEFQSIVDHLLEDGATTSFDAFYELLDDSVVKMFRILYRIQTSIKDIEGILFEWDTEEDQIRDIQTVKKNIINFKSILEPLEDLVIEMIEQKSKYVDTEGREDLDDSLDKLKKLINKLENFRDTMTLLTETNELLIARSTNKTIKILTVVNLFLLVPTIVVGFFGMNVYFGWSDQSSSFRPLIVIVLTAAALMSLGFIYFKKKKWI